MDSIFKMEQRKVFNVDVFKSGDLLKLRTGYYQDGLWAKAPHHFYGIVQECRADRLILSIGDAKPFELYTNNIYGFDLSKQDGKTCIEILKHEPVYNYSIK
jgi:hypothetical protein